MPFSASATVEKGIDFAARRLIFSPWSGQAVTQTAVLPIALPDVSLPLPWTAIAVDDGLPRPDTICPRQIPLGIVEGEPLSTTTF
jgi:hypothetical protein